MRMGGVSSLIPRRLPPATHTHALFAEQSQSILDVLVALLALQSSMKLLDRFRAVCNRYYRMGMVSKPIDGKLATYADSGTIGFWMSDPKHLELGIKPESRMTEIDRCSALEDLAGGTGGG
jgi:hypothetical protein